MHYTSDTLYPRSYSDTCNLTPETLYFRLPPTQYHPHLLKIPLRSGILDKSHNADEFLDVRDDALIPNRFTHELIISFDSGERHF